MTKTRSDRELLELAAKAAGIKLDRTIRPDGKPFYHSNRKAFATADGGWFAALTDRSDAFDLAVKRKMRIAIDSLPVGYVVVFSDDKSTPDTRVRIYNNTEVATCRAIVRAAAESALAMGYENE